MKDQYSVWADELKKRNLELEDALRRIMSGVDCSKQSFEIAEEALVGSSSQRPGKQE